MKEKLLRSVTEIKKISPELTSAEKLEQKAVKEKEAKILKRQRQLVKRTIKRKHKQKKINEVLRDMAEEKPEEVFIPKEDIHELISSIENQRNKALNLAAISEARLKSLLHMITQQNDEIVKLRKELAKYEVKE